MVSSKGITSKCQHKVKDFGILEVTNTLQTPFLKNNKVWDRYIISLKKYLRGLAWGLPASTYGCK